MDYVADVSVRPRSRSAPRLNAARGCIGRLALRFDLAAAAVSVGAGASIMEDTAYRAIAIVGAGAVLPDAPNVPAFWENVKSGRYSISEVTPGPLGSGACTTMPIRAAPDKTYSKIGGWVREYAWDPMKWRLAHSAARGRCAWMTRQKWAIACTREALRRLRLSRAAARPGPHRGDSRQRHGRREALPHRVARLSFPSTRANSPESASFAALARIHAARDHARIA